MHAHSQDLRDRVLGALERGERPGAIARRFEVSRVWVYQVKVRYVQDGERSSRAQGGHRVSRVAHLEVTVPSWVKAQPDLTLAQRCERLAEQQGIQIEPSALWHQLDKWQLSFKKTARQRARARGREAGAPSTSGSAIRAAGTRATWCSSTRPGSMRR